MPCEISIFILYGKEEQAFTANLFSGPEEEWTFINYRDNYMKRKKTTHIRIDFFQLHHC